MIKLLLFCTLFAQIKNISPNNKLGIEIITKKKETYNVLTKDKPIILTVEGPTYLRIYTRIPWPKGFEGSQIYKVILQENDIDERIITLESEVSKITKDEHGNPLSKWRSFYIEVPEGLNSYKVTHWSSPGSTILLKFAYETPKEWNDIPATDYRTIIEAIEEEKLVKYYELAQNENVILEVIGPLKLKVVSRLNYDERVFGEQSYTVLVDDNGKVNKFSVKCYKSEIIQYKNRKEIVPSNARIFYINVQGGRHTLKFTTAASLAQSISLRFLSEK